MRPDLLLGEDSVLLHYTPAGARQGDVKLVCYNLTGSRRWVQPGWHVLLCLSGSRFLVNNSEGRPLVISGDGDILHRGKLKGVERAQRHGDMLLLADKDKVWAADLELGCLWQIARSGSSGPSIDCFADGVFYWVEGDSLWCCTPGSQPDLLCPLPADRIAAAMDEWEQTTGRSALSGWYTQPGMSDFAAFEMGDRPFVFYWRVVFDDEEGQLFLANAMAPHLILCLDRFGRPRWCKYISSGCCGGAPSRLPSGQYVASSGCGGILSWLDGDGNLLFQSEPHEGVGLARAYSSEVRVLPDGRCLVDGGPGLFAYGPTGERLWVLETVLMRYHCDPDRQILAGCYWENNEPKGPSRACLELVCGI
jgi:hypothetical protein